MRLSGKAMVAGVIGWPVAQSRSPLIHNYWLEGHKIDGVYVPLPVPPENLGEAIHGLKALGFRGVNVTVPHKEAVMKFVDKLDKTAERVGAVNTIVFRGNGMVEGSNTDGFGFLESLRYDAPAWSAASGSAVVLGAGGAARGIVGALLEAGVPKLRIVNRSVERATSLANFFGNNSIQIVPWEEAGHAMEGAKLLVNTTSGDLGDEESINILMTQLPQDAVVNDIVYTPIDTPFLQVARARGNKTVDGLGMLLHQARPGFALWYGEVPEIDAALRAHVLQD